MRIGLTTQLLLRLSTNREVSFIGVCVGTLHLPEGGRHYGTALSYVSSAHLRTLKDILLELLGSFGNHWDIG